KSTWVLLFLLLPALWAVWTWCRPPARLRSPLACRALQLGLILVIGVAMINLGYGFEGSFQRLGEFTFISESLGGPAAHGLQASQAGNRFAGQWLGAMRVPLPRNYVLGMDVQKRDFERRPLSYLRGEWR